MSRPVAERSRQRKIIGLMVAVLLTAGAQYVALKIIYATRPAQVAKRK